MPVIREESSEEDVPLSKRILAPKPVADVPAAAGSSLAAAKTALPAAQARPQGTQVNGAAPAKPAQAKPELAADGAPVASAKDPARPPAPTPAPGKLQLPLPKPKAVAAATPAPPKAGVAPTVKPGGALAKPDGSSLKRKEPETGGSASKPPPSAQAAKPSKPANGPPPTLKRKEPEAGSAAAADKVAKGAAPKGAVKPADANGAAAGLKTGAGASKPPPPKPAAAKAKPEEEDDDDDDEGDSSESSSGSGSEESGSEDSSESGSDESSSEEDEPIAKKVALAGKAKAAKKTAAKAAAAPRARTAGAAPAKRQRTAKKAAKEEEEEEENIIEGDEPWFQDKDDVNWKKGAVKWRTLEHAGVLFPPAYEPHGAQFRYAGKPVPLTAEQEECATWYAAMKDTDYGQDPKFQQNFFEDWRNVLKKSAEGKAVLDFAKCDFSSIAAHVKAEDAKRKERSKEDKEADRKAKLAEEERFQYAIVDGRKEKVGNFRVEPPGLFRGRGEHPKRGRMKERIMPEDITINLGKGVPVPPVPDMGDGKAHRWGAVVSDSKVTWLAKWKDTINGQDKCVWLAANSAWKGMSDMAKYNKARALKDHIERVRLDYNKGMRDKALKMQQRSVAVYLIDQLALRVGNEKNTEEEADTVGCCSLRVEHVTLHDESKLELHFLGKDSIEFHQTVEVTPLVHELIKNFCHKKRPGDNLFDQIAPQELNAYFSDVMPGLTAKVFRTYNASFTLDKLLARTSERVTAEQIAKEGRETALYNFYSVANKEVAELCNHQRAAPKNFDEQLARIEERIDKVKAELRDAKAGGSEARIEAKTRQLEKMEADKRTKIELKNVALGTSRINYNDPRITVAWCKAHDMPITKPFNKSLLGKFTWAMSAGPDWRF